VVAEEVGGLAAQSGAATRELNKLLKIFNEKPVKWFRLWSWGIPVIEGTHLVKDTKNSLEQILDVSRQIDHLVNLFRLLQCLKRGLQKPSLS
jgi:methyl-accepting chemotaxis protein